MSWITVLGVVIVCVGIALSRGRGIKHWELGFIGAGLVFVDLFVL